MDINFQGKIVQITGAGSGFGRKAAEEFYQAGAKLILSDVNEKGLKETVQNLDVTEDRVISVVCDISKEQDVADMVKSGVDHFGRLDIAINNAGIAPPMGRIAEFKISDFDTVMSVNVRGMFLCLQQELLQMQSQGSGVILNVSSIAGLIGTPFLAAYGASKHAVIGLTKSAALEYASKNIRINAICPAFCYTPLVDEIIKGASGEKREKDMAAAIPMGRLGTAQEIVNGMMWLCSDQNSFTTGQAMAFDGGLGV